MSYRHEPPPGLGPALRTARLAARLGLRETARCLGVSAGLIADLEAGRCCPSTATAARLSALLDLDPATHAALTAAAVDGVGYSRPGRVRTLRGKRSSDEHPKTPV